MMIVETQEVRELVDFAPEGFLVTSIYLNVDAEQFPGPDHVQKSFDSVIHEAESRREEVERLLSHDARESIRNDLTKIRDYITSNFDRRNVNGVGIFSCSALDFWHVLPTSTPLESRVIFGPTPYVAPIAAFLSHSKPTAILVTDKQHARIFTMKGDEVREWSDFEDFVPQRSQQGGWSQMRYQRRSDNFASHHIDHAADLTLKLLQYYPFDWLVLGTEEQYKTEIQESLHPYLKDRVIGSIHTRIDAPMSEIIEAARTVREKAETDHIDHLMHQIQEFAGAGGRGTMGLKATLGAINEQKVNILLVQEGYREPGAVCLKCGLLMADATETCAACNEPATRVDDIVAEAIQRSMFLGSVVEVATEFEKLKPIGCVGAILYY